MRILFYTLVKVHSLDDRGIYSDMIDEFVKRGHQVDYYFPSIESFTLKGDNYSLNSIKLKQESQKNNNFFIKFLSYLIQDYKFSKIIKSLSNQYNLFIIATPSIFQSKVVKVFKSKNTHSKVLLLLKDIFPDNAFDLGFFRKKFPLNYLFNYLKKIE